MAESTFRRLKGAELLPDVYAGVQYVDGAPPNSSRQQKMAAWWFGCSRFPCPEDPKGVKRQHALCELWV
jgi:hypothetical protein